MTQIFSINLLNVPEDLYFLNTLPQQLSCGASGTPKPSIAWITEKNSIVQPKDGLLTITNDGSLKFNSFKLNQYDKEIHDVTYRCKISNSVGNIISRQIKVKAGWSLFEQVRVRAAARTKVYSELCMTENG